MNYSANINYLSKTLGMEKAAEILSASGFKEIDYTPPVIKDCWKQEMHKNMEIFSKTGLTVHQTHAPFNRYNQYGDKFLECMNRAFEATQYMGAKYMVVHGDEFDFNKSKYTPEKALEYNYRLFAPFVEKADGIKIAFENVFEDKSVPRFCSEVTELKQLIEKFKSDNVCCCWDFGHANVAFGKEQPEKIKYMKGYIECTHVHDSAHAMDLHLLPFLGEIEWDKCIKSLKEIQYSGNLSLELVYGQIPAAVAETFSANLFKSLSYLWEME